MSIKLQEIVLSGLLTQGFPDLPRIADSQRHLCFEMLQDQWNSLKEVSHPDIQGIMCNIEDATLASGKECGSTPEQKCDYLRSRTDELFRKLAEEFKPGDAVLKNVPVDALFYGQQQKKWGDEALVVLYEEVAKQLGDRAPLLTESDEIRSWFSDPVNDPLLATIKGLVISNKGIKTVPLEIINLKKLGVLSLGCNQISSLPMDLFNNCARLRSLNLNHNRISIMPSKFYHPEIRELFLNNNQILSLPPDFCCPKLDCLGLGRNKISSLPPRFYCPQLQMFHLFNNRISGFPADLECPELKLLDLSNNRISVLPEKFDGVSPPSEIDLSDNPLLSHSNKITGCRELGSFMDSEIAFQKHRCLCKFSVFVQSIYREIQNKEKVQDAFGRLDSEDQRLILDIAHGKLGSVMGRELNAFDDMNLFFHAVREAISAKFDRLPEQDQARVCQAITGRPNEVCTGQATSKDGAFDNILLLIDVIDKVETPEQNEPNLGAGYGLCNLF